VCNIIVMVLEKFTCTYIFYYNKLNGDPNMGLYFIRFTSLIPAANGFTFRNGFKIKLLISPNK
jgi:hypothetical protein